MGSVGVQLAAGPIQRHGVPVLTAPLLHHITAPRLAAASLTKQRLAVK